MHVCPPQKTVYGASVIIFEGIMAFTDKKLLQVGQGYCPLTCSAGQWNVLESGRYLSVHVVKHVFLCVCGRDRSPLFLPVL